MKLSRTEWWILANQYLILEQLCQDKEDARYYKEAREALERGYTRHYSRIAQHIYEEELTEEQCDEVGDILCMFEELQRGYDRAPDKAGITEKDVQFLGFDGNREAEYLSYAAYFRREGGGRFPELKSHPHLNSHCPLLGIYRRMLQEWHKSGRKLDLSIGDVARIVAILHPPPKGEEKPTP